MASSIRYGFIVLAAFLYCVQVTAAPIVRPASSSDVFVKGGQTLNINNHWGEILDVPFTTGSKKVDVPVVQSRGFGFARVGGMIKSAINSNPVKYAATAGVVYLISKLPGATFDPLTGEMVRTSGDYPVSGDYYLATTSGGVLRPDRFSAPLAACRSLMSTSSNWFPRVTQYGTDLYRCERVYQSVYCPTCTPDFFGTIGKHTESCPDNGWNSDTLSCNSEPLVKVPFAPSDYDDLVSNTGDIPAPDLEALGKDLYVDFPASFDGPDDEAFTGPDSIDLPSITTTTTDHVTGDVTVSESIPSVSFEYATSPLNITATPSTTTNTYTNGNLTNTSTTTAPSVSPVTGGGGGGGGNVTIEVPTDCAFMPTVCAFIDWVETPFKPEEVDFAELIEDDDFTRSVTFSGSAVCPSPTVISTDLGEFEFSWQPACTWAEMLKPLLLIAALLSAIYITLGIGRAD